MSTTVAAANGNTSLAKPAPQKLVVHDESAVSYLMDTARFEHLFRIARTLANSSLTPKHLKGKDLDETVANCFRVVNQAMRWQFDPFCVADETYVVSGKLGYQGKLVAAVVNSRAGLRGRLWPTYDGTGANRQVTIHGTFADENEERTIELTVAQARTQNEMWAKDPDQKLFYSGVIKWARRHCPEVIMGVLTEEDLERIQIDTTANILPTEPMGNKSDALAARLASRAAHTATEDVQSAATGEESQVTEENTGEGSQVTEREPGDDPVEQESTGGLRLSDLALAIEGALHEPKITAAENTAQKQQVIEALAEKQLTLPEAQHLQKIVEENAARLAKKK